jgi:hypothetical protein
MALLNGQPDIAGAVAANCVYAPAPGRREHPARSPFAARVDPVTAAVLVGAPEGPKPLSSGANSLDPKAATALHTPGDLDLIAHQAGKHRVGRIRPSRALRQEQERTQCNSLCPENLRSSTVTVPGLRDRGRRAATHASRVCRRSLPCRHKDQCNEHTSGKRSAPTDHKFNVARSPSDVSERRPSL